MSVPLLKFKNENEDNDASRQQERILEAEMQQQEFENKVNAALGIEELNQEIYGKHSAKIIPISGATEIPKQDEQDLFTIQSLIEIVGLGADSQEIAQFLEKAIGEIDAKVEKDKSQAKKYVKQLQAIMVVIEQVAARQRNADTNLQNSNLQNSLRQMRDKLSTALKQDSPENLRNLLKSAELKNTLQQGLNNAAKNPDLTQDIASRQQATERSGQQGRDAKNSLSDILRNVMDRGREMLGMNQQRMADSRLNNISLQQNMNTTVTPQNAAIQNNAAMLASVQAARMAQPQQVMQQSIAQNNMQMANIAREAARGDVSQQIRTDNVSLQMRTEVAPQARTEPARNEQPQPNVVRDNPPSTTPQLDAKPAIAPTTDTKPIVDAKPSVNPTDNTPPTTVKPEQGKLPECCKPHNRQPTDIQSANVADIASRQFSAGDKQTTNQNILAKASEINSNAAAALNTVSASVSQQAINNSASSISALDVSSFKINIGQQQDVAASR